MFSPGTMVEVSSKIHNAKVVWVPAIIIKEIKEYVDDDDDDHDDVEYKYIVKVCDKFLSCKGNEARPNKTVDLPSLRPTPPSFWVEEYQLMEYVEVFHGTGWRQGRVMGTRTQQQYLVLLEGTRKQLVFKHSDLRPLKVWEDGVWKTRESMITQGSENKMCDSVMNEKESDSPVTSSSGTTATPLRQIEAETQRKTLPKKTLPRNQNGSGNDSTGENENSEDNSRKRKREENLCYVASVEEDKAKDTTMVLPFEKKLPIWKTLESMEVFKKVPQSPHFSPLLETGQDSREISAVGLMYTFAGLLEEVKALQHDNRMSSLLSLHKSFAELERYGFNVKVPQLRISKLFALRDRQSKKMEELRGFKKVTAEKESCKDRERTQDP